MATQVKARVVISGTDDTGGAFASVGRKFTALQSEASGLKGKLTGIAAAVSTAFAAIGAMHIVGQLDELNDLSKKTGIAAVKLGGIGFAAQQAGGDLQSAALATGKLNRTLAEAAAGGKTASEPFKLLGISVTDAAGKTKAADQVLIDLANTFEHMEDGPEKVALAVRIFGKAGADLIPLLNEGGKSLQKNIAYFERYARVTPEAVVASDEFSDTLIKLRLVGGALTTEAVANLLPAFQAVAEKLIEMKEGADQTNPIFDALRIAFETIAIVGANVAFVFGGVGREIGAIGAQIAALARGDIQGFTAISDAVKADGERARAELDAFEKKVTRVLDKPTLSSGDFARGDRAKGGKKPAPRLAANGAADEALAILKKQLTQQVKAIEEGAAEQKLAIEFGNIQAQAAYEDGFTTLKQFYAESSEARAEALRTTTDSLDKKIAAYEAFARNPALKPQDRVEAETKIADAKAKRARAEQDAANKTVLAFNDERHAIEQLQDKYADVQASILNLQGRTLEASRSRIEREVRDVAKVIAQAGGDPAQAEQLRSLLTNTERLSEAKRQYGIITEAARDAEESLYLAAQESSATELDTLRNVGEARQQSLVQLQALAQVAQQLAGELKTPDAIAFARQLSLGFKKAAAEADPLLMKIRDIGQEAGSAIASNAEEALLHWGGVRKLLGGIEQDLVRIAARKLFTEPLGNWFGNMIGGNGQSSGGGGFLGLLGSLFGSGGGGGFGTGASYGNMDFAGFFAEGGTLQPGQWGIAGENGAEPIYAGDTPLHVTPNGGGRAITINQSFMVSGPVDKRTQDQLAMAAMSGAQRALRRNG